MANLSGWHLLILLAVILLLFGAARLPALAKSMGQSARLFKGELKQMKAEDEAAPGTGTAAADRPATGYTVNGERTDRLPGAEEPGTPPKP